MSTIYLARHGETAWNLTGQLIGITDLPLTESGEHSAQRLGERLMGLKFAKIFSSPLQRTRQTCELSGFGAIAEIDPDLVEWDYGRYEGRREEDIQAECPGWNLFRDGCPEGETPEQVCARADRVTSRMRGISGNVLVFTSGHFIQVLAARWLGVGLNTDTEFSKLSTASLSSLSYRNNQSRSMNRFWNEIGQVDLEPEVRAHSLSRRRRINRIRRAHQVNTREAEFDEYKASYGRELRC